MREKVSGRLTRAVRALAPVPWALIVVGGILVISLPGGSDRAVARNAVSLMIALFFGVLLVRLLLTARLERRRARWAQLTLAGAFLLWAGGSVLISDNQAYGAVPFPAPGEVLNVASYLLLATFLLIDVRRRRPSLADFLDAAVVWGATITVTSLVLVTPVARNFDHSGLALLVAVLFPLINLVLAAVVVGQVLLRERPRSRADLDACRGLLDARCGRLELPGRSEHERRLRHEHRHLRRLGCRVRVPRRGGVTAPARRVECSSRAGQAGRARRGGRAGRSWCSRPARRTSPAGWSARRPS